MAQTRGLLRAAAADPALQSVWRRVNGDSETRLRELIAARLDEGADPLTARLLAAAATDAIRVGLEQWSATDASDESPADLALRAFEQLSEGIRGV